MLFGFDSPDARPQLTRTSIFPEEAWHNGIEEMAYDAVR